MKPGNKEETARGMLWTEKKPANNGRFSNLTSEKKNARKESISALWCEEMKRTKIIYTNDHNLNRYLSLVFDEINVKEDWNTWHCGCPISGGVQDQAGWGSEQPDLVEGVPVHGSGLGLGDL